MTNIPSPKPFKWFFLLNLVRDNVTLCSVVEECRYSTIRTDDRDTRIVRNVGTFVPICAASNHKKWQSQTTSWDLYLLFNPTNTLF